MLKITI